jgi:molecular chaperone HtpG
LEAVVDFGTRIEQSAKAASQLEAFSHFNLYGVRDAVTKLSSLIGGNGIFQEYTLHDISHIDKLLTSLEWIIPPSTWERMAVTDCLMTTLAIYFHLNNALRPGRVRR